MPTIVEESRYMQESDSLGNTETDYVEVKKKDNNLKK